MVLPGSNSHTRSGILPPEELTQEFLGAQFFFDYIFCDPKTNEPDINYYLDMSVEDLKKLNHQMHEEAAMHEDSVERHKHISDYLSIVGQYFARLAARDGLTNLFNKRAFANSLDRSLDRLSRMQGTERREKGSNQIGLIDIDLNRFKPINDVFGHATGNDILIKTAHLLQDSIRLQDVAGRLGGDEFSVLITGASEEEINTIRQRLEDNFNQLEIKILASTKINISEKDREKLDRKAQDQWVAADLSEKEYRILGLDIRKTDQSFFLSIDASFGVAISEPGLTADQLEAKADANMYRNKSSQAWSHYTR